MDSKMLSGARPNWFRQTARAGMAALLPRRLFLVRGSKSRPVVSLTFDDGPHPEFTPRLLDQLAKHQIQATFFLVGREAESHPDLVRRIVEHGHQLGNHTWNHHPPHHVNARDLAEEVQRTQRLLTDLTGQAPKLFRPPLGKLTPRKLAAIWRLGLSVVLWSMDPKDYQANSAGELRERLRGQLFRAGAVLLMHDNRPHALDVIGDLANLAAAQRLEFVTVSRLIEGEAA